MSTKDDLVRAGIWPTAADGIINTVTASGAQTITGVKTFSDGIVVEDGELKLGAGAGTAVTATAAEINARCDVSAMQQTITTAGAQAITAGKSIVILDNGTTAIASTIADASAHAGIFHIKATTEPAVGQDHTCTITTGTWNGTNKVATFADALDALVVMFDASGNGTVISNTGSVSLSG